MKRRRAGSLLGAERLEDRRLLAAWAVQDGGLNAVSRSIATAADGSAIFVAGGFGGSASFGRTSLTSMDGAVQDIFVTRMNPDGSHAWAVRAGGPGVDYGLDVAASVGGSVLVAGQIGGTASFGTTVLASSGGFVAQLDASGAFVWATGIAGVKVAAIASLADGASVVTGSFSGAVSFGATTLVSSGLTDIFVAKLNPDGSFAWATKAGGDQSNFAADVAVLADGSALVAGTIRGPVAFGGITLDGGDLSDGGFVAKLTPSGSFAWATEIPNAPVAAIASFADGDTAVTGSFRGAASFGGTTLVSSGPDIYRDIFVAKLSPLGVVEWGTRMGGESEDQGAGIAALPDGSTLVTGFLTADLHADPLIAKLNPDGSQAWVARAGGPGQDRGAGIAAFPDGSAVVTGAFGDTMTFGSTHLTGGSGSNDHIFTARAPANGVLDEPRAPSGLSGLAGDAAVQLDWVAPTASGGTPILDYIVQVSSDGGDTWRTFADDVSAATHATVTGLTNGTPYAFRVSAVNEDAVVLPAATYGPVTPFGKASPPTITRVLPGDNVAALTWSAPASDGDSAITDYRIEVSSNNGDSWTLCEDGISTATDAIVAPLANGVPLLFRVAAVTSAGVGAYSANSVAVTLLRTWPKQLGGSGADSAERTVALADGSVLVAGYFQNNVPFGGVFTSRGGDDAFVAKFNPDGSTAWFVQGGGTSDDYSNGLATGADGSVFVSGYFSGTASFGGTTLTSSGGSDAFFAKLTANGDYRWAMRAGGAADDFGNNIAVFADGCAIVTGSFQGTASFGSTTLTSRGFRDIFVAKLNPTGSYEWIRQVGGAGDEWGYGIATLGDGSALITGGIWGTAAFGNTTLSSSSYDAFTAKLAPDGSWAWATLGGGDNYDEGSAVTLLADGSALVVGQFWGATATFGTTHIAGSGGYDVFVAKLNPDGSYAWATRAGGDSDDYGFGIATLADGSAVLTGSFRRTATFGGTAITSDSSSLDAFVAALRPDGSWKWSSRAGGWGTDWGLGVAARADGSAVVAGAFGSGDLPGAATFGGRLLVSRGLEDAFIATIGPTGVFGLLPGAPTSVQAVPDDGQVRLSWTDPSPFNADAISDYLIQYRRDDETAWTTVDEGVSPALSVTVGNLAPGTTYLFRVAAVNAVGTGSFSTAATAVVPAPPTASVTLAVSPGSVMEDGATSLVYTFTRTGPTTGALMVNYDIAGTADSTDYTGGTPGNGKTITFAAGSSTATLTIDPTADTMAEPHETVILTLESGTGYTIGTTTPVTGTITNDDLPAVTLAVSPGSVMEDGATSLVYTFTRTGPTTGALMVNYTVGGSATLGSDYTGIATSGTPKTVTIPVGVGTATVTVDPTQDVDIEQDETVILTLVSGTDYTIGTVTPVISTITNDDVTVPAAPTKAAGTPGNTQVSLTWTAPISNGGSTITDFIVQFKTVSAAKWLTFNDGTSTSTSATVTGLTNGMAYVFRVQAVNAAGQSLFSISSSPVTPRTVPGAPTRVKGTARNARVNLSWTAPRSNGGSSITDYLIEYSSDDGANWTRFSDAVSARTSAAVTGLTNGKRYVFRVRAVNAAGEGSWSATSAAVTPRR